MSFEDVMAAVMRWTTATEALAALGAELSLAQTGETPPPEIAVALRAVSTAAGLPAVEDLDQQQRAIALGVIHLYIHQALDTLDAPGRAPGWTFTDPVILDGWGRGSTMVPALIAGAHPDLAEVTSFLDVGTGVGLLAVAASAVWPSAQIVGIDPWTPSLDRAKANVTQAGLGHRITLRHQDVAEIDDVETYDCIWLPTFFLAETTIEQALPPLYRSLRPGGWLALGRFRSAPDPLVESTATLRTIRGGGCDLDSKRAVELLEQAGCHEVQVVQPSVPMPLELIIGQRPMD
jgi:SAM-dependent methyltransferase